MAVEGESTFRISIDGNAAAVSKEISSSSRLAAKAIGEFENEVKTLSGDLRRLKGNGTEVTETKRALKKRIDEAKTSISALTVALAKNGTSYAAAAAAAKKYGDGVGRFDGVKALAKKLGSGLGGVLAPTGKKLGAALAPATKRLGTLLAPVAKRIGTTLAPAGRAIVRFAGGGAKAIGKLASAAKPVAESALPMLAKGLGLIVTGGAAAAAAAAAVGAALVAGVVAVGAFGIAAAVSAQKLERQRAVLLGTTENAKAMADQIGALAAQVPQGADELNALSHELSKARLSGKTMVDTLNAVAQASAAVDAGAGAKIQELVTRGQMSGRFFLNQLELQGTGINFDDVAQAYADGTKKSLAAARAELVSGAAPLEAGAEALRKATEKKFGKLNLSNAFALDTAPKKFFDQFKILSKGINLEPLEKGLKSAFEQLDPAHPLGAAVQSFMTTFGSGIAEVAGKSIPLLLEGFKWLVVGALKVTNYFLEMRKSIKDAFAAEGFIGVGKEIVKGVWKGIFSIQPFLLKAVASLGGDIKNAFKQELQIQSPSKVFAKYGRHTVEGYAQGIERTSGRADSAVRDMVSAPDLPSLGSGGGGDNVVVNIHVGQGADASSMQTPAFLAALTRAIRDARTSQAVAT